ncbi:hypothetical protein J6590_108559 [Homalodisca vitripennis]|nr:hypothetical protein J6590_108559 [Homalodisca vitripennis]
MQELKAIQRKTYIAKFIKEAQDSPKAKWYKRINNKYTNQPWFNATNMSRYDIINIIRLRIGHANVNYNLHRLKKYFTPLCLKCTSGQIETIEHFLLQCPSNFHIRQQCFKKINRLIRQKNYTLRDILALEDIEIYKEINLFISHCYRKL